MNELRKMQQFVYKQKTYNIGEILRDNYRFYCLDGPNIFGGGTMKSGETLEDAVVSRLIREKH